MATVEGRLNVSDDRREKGYDLEKAAHTVIVFFAKIFENHEGWTTKSYYGLNSAPTTTAQLDRRSSRPVPLDIYGSSNADFSD